MSVMSQATGVFVGFTTVFMASSMAAVDDCQENHYRNGTNCLKCSGCPRGFGVKRKCTSKTNTDCIACWPGYDYSNTTGFERCILCDKYSNCLPGNSKKIKNCTIFSGPVCDGCEDGHYRKPQLGCVKCSPKCSILQVETKSCNTHHDRECKEKGSVTLPSPSNFPTGPSSTANSEKVKPKVPASTTGGTSPYPPLPIPLAKDARLWGGVGGGSSILIIAFIVAVIIRKKSKNRRKLDATAKQRQPLMSSVKPGLDDPISSLTTEGRRFITRKINGRYHDGYFYWQMCADKVGLQAECESWKHADNPAEKFLTAYGEKAGSTIRKLVQVLRDRDVGLTQIANEIEKKFLPPQGVNETTV